MARPWVRLFEFLVKLPWWAGLVAAAIAYTIFTYVVPAFNHDRPLLIGLKSAASLLAWLAAVLFSAASLAGLVRSFHARRVEAAQKSIESIRALASQQFEALIEEYWRRRGFTVTKTSRNAGGAMDFIPQRDGKRYLVRCERWRALIVDVGAVRDLFGAMKAEDASGAYLLTSGRFTAEAVEFAQDKPLELIDGRTLGGMVEEGRRAGSAGGERPLPTETAPMCPACGASMVKRSTQRDASEGSDWECAAIPRCRGTRAA